MDINRHSDDRRRSGLLFLVLAAVGTAFVGLGGAALIVMLVLPALWVHAALRTRLWVLPLLALEALVVAYAASGALTPALLLWVLIAPAGIAAALLQKVKFGNFYTVFVSSVLVTAGIYACVCGPSLLAGEQPFAEVRRTLLEAGEMAKPLYEMAGAGDLWALVFDAGTLDTMFAQMGIPVLYAVGAVVALSNTLLMHAMNRRHDVELCRLSPFASWRVPQAFAGVFFGLMLLGLIAMLAGWEHGTALSYTVFVIWVMPMALVGLSVIYGKRKRLAPVIVLAVLCVPLYLYVPPILAIIGMFGMRRDRRLRGDGNGNGGGV